jgi:hypothetical protein
VVDSLQLWVVQGPFVVHPKLLRQDPVYTENHT